jgi:hypothetical protein
VEYYSGDTGLERKWKTHVKSLGQVPKFFTGMKIMYCIVMEG